MINYNKLMESNLLNLRQSLTDLSLDEFIVSTLEGLMTIERNEHLEKSKNPEEKGNGHYTRLFRSLRKNSMTINIPRTRTGSFSPFTMELIKKNSEDINDLCILLTKKGMTTRDISKVLEEFFGEKKSPTSINKLAKSFHELRKTWDNTSLEKHYLVVFADATTITTRRGDSYSKESVHITYGIREDLKREILSIEINPTETAYSWEDSLKKLKEKGIKKINLFVADGLTGLEGKVSQYFPETKFQKCVVHKKRNILRKTRPKDKAEMAIDLKDVFNNFSNNSTKEKAVKKLDKFCDKWRKKYPNINNFFNEGVKEYYFTYVDFPVETRRMIYTTNSIENLNRNIKKATKNKLSFESPKTLLDYVFVICKDFEDRSWMKYPLHQFKNLTR